MDPAITALLGPIQQLGVIGSIIIGLGIIAWLLWTRTKELYIDVTATRALHLADVKQYADKYAEILAESAKTQTALANAIDRIGDKIK